MRKGNELLANLGEVEDNDEGIERLLDIVCLCLKRQRPDFEHDVTDEEGNTKTTTNYEVMEELFDLETMFKVIELFLGVKLNDPKLLEEAAKAALQQQAETAQAGTN